MTADDAQASGKAREVEVVARALWDEWNPSGPSWSRTNDDSRDDARHSARATLAALAPLRAAERQEAAREALLAAAGDIAERIAAVVDPDSWRRDGFDDGWASAGEAITKLLRDRADGVTGREDV